MRVNPGCMYQAEPLDLGSTDHVFYQNLDRDIASAPDFVKVDGKDTWRSLDPRLIDPVRGIRMQLDRPPLQPRNVQPLSRMYDDPNSERVRTGFYLDGYPSMYGGDILYYVDPSLGVVYDSPVYSIRSSVVPFVFQDPMGGLKPQYDRVPLYKNNTSVATYSFDQDQMSYREDLIARQSRKMNQSDYNLYVAHFNRDPVSVDPVSSTPGIPER